jgi:hypothetical protein
VHSDKLVIGVHVLTEFEYCPRAGLIAYESDDEDTGQESGVENLDYLPLYELGRINRQLNLLVDRVMGWAVVAVVITLVTCVFMLLISWLFVFSGVIGMIIVSFPLARFGRRILILADRRSKAEKAEKREPNKESPKDETIGWWEIQRAGFDASVYKKALVDQDFGIRGKPRKVLRNGDLVIPVFFCRRGTTLKRQHYIRIAAYCQLIEHSELAQSPYGLVVEQGSYVAHVLKNTQQSRDALRKELHAARRIIRDVAATGESPLPPRSSGPCKECPIGFPRLHRPGETELVRDGKQLPIVKLRSHGRWVYHSMCGDRFEWVAPHNRVAAIGLERGS